MCNKEFYEGMESASYILWKYTIYIEGSLNVAYFLYTCSRKGKAIY